MNNRPDRYARRQKSMFDKTQNGQKPESTVDALKAIFNRNFTVVALINLIEMTAYYLTFVTSTAYARSIFDISLSAAGLTAGIMVIGCLVGRFVTGNLISLFGSPRILFGGLLLFAASFVFDFVVTSLPLLYLQRFMAGVGVGVVGTATGTIVAYVVPLRFHGLGISMFTLSTALALALGPFLGIALSQWSGYEVLNIFCLISALLCLFFYFFLKGLPETRHKHRPFIDLYSYIDPRVVRFSLVAVITCLGYGCIQAFMPSLAMERGLTAESSIYFLLYGIAAICTRPMVGRIFDLRGENIIFYPCLILTSLALFLLANAQAGWMLLLSAIFMGIGFGNFQSAGQAVSLSLVSRSRFAQATTTFFVFFDLGIGMGPYIFGFLVPAVGYNGMYNALAAVEIVALVLYYFLHGRNGARRRGHRRTK